MSRKRYKQVLKYRLCLIIPQNTKTPYNDDSRFKFQGDDKNTKSVMKFFVLGPLSKNCGIMTTITMPMFKHKLRLMSVKLRSTAGITQVIGSSELSLQRKQTLFLLKHVLSPLFVSFCSKCHRHEKY